VVGSPESSLDGVVPNSGLLRYLGIFSIERVFPEIPKVLRKVLHTESCSFIKPLLVINDRGSILGKKGLLFAGEKHKVQSKPLLPALSHAGVKGLVPGF